MGRRVAAMLAPMLALLATPTASQMVVATPDMMDVVTNPLSQVNGCCGAQLGDGICSDGSAAIGATRCCGSDEGHCNIMCCDCKAGCKAPVDEEVPPEAEGIAEELQALPLNEYPMIVTHDAGTGYEQRYYCNNMNPYGNYATCQRGSFIEQLGCGARMFDLRPYRKADGRLVMHHGRVVFDMDVKDAMAEVEEWLSTRPTELVILYVNLCDGDQGDTDLQQVCISEVSDLIKEKGYHVMGANKPNVMGSMTVKKALEKGKQDRRPGGGSILVVYKLGANYYDKAINCYKQPTLSTPAENCVSTDHTERVGRYSQLNDYLNKHLNALEVPFANGTLWNTQAHWQYDEYSVVHGLATLSCILAESSASNINNHVAQSVKQDHFKAINLLQVDYVCHGGKNLYTELQAFARRYLAKKTGAAAASVVEEYAARRQPAGPTIFRPCYGRALRILAPYTACAGVLAVVAFRALRRLAPRRPDGEVGAAASAPLAVADAECAGEE